MRGLNVTLLKPQNQTLTDQTRSMQLYFLTVTFMLRVRNRAARNTQKVRSLFQPPLQITDLALNVQTLLFQ